mmetsp:Transcript_1100/g.3430  ORF Transcript_1100/g.3430 Transcript_1100/m.3430 type:complete len:380 (-) Transcript_1100:133-1272(-)
MHELPQPPLRVGRVNLDHSLKQQPEGRLGRHLQLPGSKVVSVDPDVVLAHHTELVRLVKHGREVHEVERRHQNVVVTFLDHVQHPGRSIEVERAIPALFRQTERVHRYVVGLIPARLDHVEPPDQLGGLGVALGINHRDVTLVPTVVVQEVQQGVGLEVLRVLGEHAYGRRVGPLAHCHAELNVGAAPGHHGEPAQGGHLSQQPALVVGGVPGAQDHIHGVRHGVLGVEHHSARGLDVEEDLVHGASLDVAPRPPRDVRHHLPGAVAHVLGVRANPGGNHAGQVDDCAVLALDVVQRDPERHLLVQHLVALLADHGLFALGLEAQHPDLHLHLKVVGNVRHGRRGLLTLPRVVRVRRVASRRHPDAKGEQQDEDDQGEG